MKKVQAQDLKTKASDQFKKKAVQKTVEKVDKQEQKEVKKETVSVAQVAAPANEAKKGSFSLKDLDKDLLNFAKKRQ